jgi:hypothetical protein
MEEIIYYDDMMKAEIHIQKNDDEKFDKIEMIYSEPRPIFQFFNIGGIFKNERINPEK